MSKTLLSFGILMLRNASIQTETVATEQPVEGTTNCKITDTTALLQH